MSKLTCLLLVSALCVSLYSLFFAVNLPETKAYDEVQQSESPHYLPCTGGLDYIRECWTPWEKYNPDTECTSNPDKFLWITRQGEMKYYDTGSIGFSMTGGFIVTSYCTTQPAQMGLRCQYNCQ